MNKAEKENKETEYVLFGKEWKKYMNTLSKPYLVNMLKDTLIKNQQLEAKVKELLNDLCV